MPLRLAARFGLLGVWVALGGVAGGEPLVYESDSGEGNRGPGKGMHLVFIASDHEYRSEETLPALARLLARHHGFRCTVVFGVDENGAILPGASNVPGIEALDSADLMVVFTRHQRWPADQMQHFVDYLKRGGPIVGLRTATHGFSIPRDSPFAKYGETYDGEDYLGGFGRQILGETWVGHHGHNHRSSTRLDIVREKSNHPILRGVKDMWVQCGGYHADPLLPCEVLAMAQPLVGMEQDSGPDRNFKPVPGAWTRSYQSESGTVGRVFTSTYGASNDIENDGFRRMLTNGCFWAVGLEDAIQDDMDISFVGPYHATWRHDRGERKKGLKPQDLAGWDAPIVPLEP
ncbi:MAG: ThuA domain-containing protein [Pirellulales bacterium]|nr:ThuA domain-containing protein [Pirellulales bacterium]